MNTEKYLDDLKKINKSCKDLCHVPGIFPITDIMAQDWKSMTDEEKNEFISTMLESYREMEEIFYLAKGFHEMNQYIKNKKIKLPEDIDLMKLAKKWQEYAILGGSDFAAKGKWPDNNS